MLSRELTITISIDETYKYPYFAILNATKDNKWLGTACGNTEQEAISRALRCIITSVNNRAYHFWRDWDNE